MIPANQVARLRNAIPFWMSLLLVPIAIVSASYGSWTVLLLPVFTWYFFAALDAILGLNTENADLTTGEENLTWYKAITLIWTPFQFCLLFGMIWYVTGPGDEHLNPLETIVLFFGIGVISGTIGINYSHELMHQKDRGERFLADVLLAMVMYSHFRSEHLLVHHSYVGTPRDPVTARLQRRLSPFLPACSARIIEVVIPGRGREAREEKLALDRPVEPLSSDIGHCRASCCYWRF